MSVAVKRVVEKSLLDLLLSFNHVASIHQSLDVWKWGYKCLSPGFFKRVTKEKRKIPELRSMRNLRQT